MSALIAGHREARVVENAVTVRMGTVWERTTDVLGGRSSMIAPVAILAIFLPAVVRSGYAVFAAPGPVSQGAIGSLLTIVASIVSVWAQLTIIGIATYPETTRADAARQALARLGPAIGIVIVIAVAAIVLALPPIVALVAIGVDLSGAMKGVAMTAPPVGISLFVLAWFLAYAALCLWVGARLVLLNPVILHERLGLGAVRRSIALTRGLTWRIVGLILLFLIVLLVASGAAQAVTGIVFRLILGADAKPLATFLGGVAGVAVSTIFTVIAAAFTAQLYVAVRGPRDADIAAIFLDAPTSE